MWWGPGVGHGVETGLWGGRAADPQPCMLQVRPPSSRDIPATGIPAAPPTAAPHHKGVSSTHPSRAQPRWAPHLTERAFGLSECADYAVHYGVHCAPKSCI